MNKIDAVAVLTKMRESVFDGYENGEALADCDSHVLKFIDKQIAAISATAPVAAIQPPGEARRHIHTWKHAANEWADAAYAGLQWLRNIRDGVTTDVYEALQNIEACCAHAKVVADNVCDLDAAPISEGSAPAGVESPGDKVIGQQHERAAFNKFNNDTDCPLAGLTPKQAAWKAWAVRSGAQPEAKAEQAEHHPACDRKFPSLCKACIAEHADDIDSLIYPPKAMLKREDWDAATRKPKAAHQPASHTPEHIERVLGKGEAGEILTWRERSDAESKANKFVERANVYMEAEIADLRAALARTAPASAASVPSDTLIPAVFALDAAIHKVLIAGGDYGDELSDTHLRETLKEAQHVAYRALISIGIERIPGAVNPFSAFLPKGEVVAPTAPAPRGSIGDDAEFMRLWDAYENSNSFEYDEAKAALFKGIDTIIKGGGNA